MSFNPIEALGISEAALESLSPAQREVLDQLTEHEVSVITSVQQRFNAAANDVTAQSVDQPDPPAIVLGCQIIE